MERVVPSYKGILGEVQTKGVNVIRTQILVRPLDRDDGEDGEFEGESYRGINEFSGIKK